MTSSGGGDGDDTISGGAQDDTVWGGKGFDIISGDEGNDTLYGEEGIDQISGGPGDDDLFGGDDGDTIDGGEGNDDIFGEDGADKLYGDNGDDNFWGGFGIDTYWGGKGSDTIYFDPLQEGSTEPAAWIVTLPTNLEAGTAQFYGGVETLYDIENVVTGDAADTIIGNSASNTLDGKGGNDFISGLDGDDTILGGGGDDVLQGGTGVNFIDGGKGVDEANYYWATTGVNVSLSISGTQLTNVSEDTLFQIENVFGSIYDDKLTGDAGANLLNGHDGTDQLFGEAGDDTLLGGEGDDLINGGLGSDFIDGGEGNDTASFYTAAMGVTVDLNLNGQQNTGDGLDTLINIENVDGSKFDDVLLGNASNNVLRGFVGGDIIFAGDGGDHIDGGGGIDIIAGGGGNDQIIGGEDDDQMAGGAGSDTFIFRQLDGQDTIWDFEDGLDLIDFQQVPNVSSFDDLDITQAGADTVIIYDKLASITLKNFDATLLGQDDFIISAAMELERKSMELLDKYSPPTAELDPDLTTERGMNSDDFIV